MHSGRLRTSDLQKTVLKLGFGFILGLCSFAEDSGKENGSYFNRLARAWVLEDCWVRQFLLGAKFLQHRDLDPPGLAFPTLQIAFREV